MTTFNGTLDVTLSDAQIVIKQHGSKQDFYCLVTLGSSGLKNLMEGETWGKEKFQTKVHNGAGQHPVWNESHIFALKNMKLDSHLKVKIFDKDVVKDDYVGLCRITLEELLKFDKQGVQYFPIFKKGALRRDTSESIGQIGVGVKFNCTEIPQGHSDLKSQFKEAVTRKDQEPLGVKSSYQEAHPTNLKQGDQVPTSYPQHAVTDTTTTTPEQHPQNVKTTPISQGKFEGTHHPGSTGVTQPMSQGTSYPGPTGHGVTQPIQTHGQVQGTQVQGTQPTSQIHQTRHV